MQLEMANSDKYQMPKKDKSILQENHVFLIDNIESSENFWSHLFNDGLITRDEKEEFTNGRACKIGKRKISHLLCNILPKKGPNAFGTFLEVLEVTNHINAAQLLKDERAKNGVDDMANSDKYQMSKKDKSILQKNHVFLIDNIESSENFWSHLFKDGLITRDEKEEFTNDGAYEIGKVKISHLLCHILPKKGPTAFDTFLQVLKETNHDHAAQLLIDERQKDTNKQPAHDSNEACTDDEEIKRTILAGKAILPFKPFESGQIKGCYPMTVLPRGHVVIINNTKFDDKEKYADREGSEYDIRNITKIFKELHLQPDPVKENLTAEEIREHLKFMAQAYKGKRSKDAILVVFIMSHGSANYVIGTDGEVVKVSEIYGYFNATDCPDLRDKPKLFFINACQSKNVVAGTGAGDASSDVDETDCHPLAHHSLDMLTVLSAVEGASSQRHKNKGSLFVRTLFLVLNYYAHNTKMQDMLTKMLEIMTSIETNQCDEDNFNPQAFNKSCFNTLRKDLFFL